MTISAHGNLRSSPLRVGEVRDLETWGGIDLPSGLDTPLWSRDLLSNYSVKICKDDERLDCGSSEHKHTLFEIVLFGFFGFWPVFFVLLDYTSLCDRFCTNHVDGSAAHRWLVLGVLRWWPVRS